MTKNKNINSGMGQIWCSTVYFYLAFTNYSYCQPGYLKIIIKPMGVSVFIWKLDVLYFKASHFALN